MKIGYLKLETSRLLEQLHFYRDILQLPVAELSDSSFQVIMGYSLLEFRQNSSATPYHIAFHIPAEQEERALVWLEKRVEMLKNGKDKIIDFPAWNARSVYFYDSDKNIVEFISRRHLYPPAEIEFSPKSILGISEIGVGTRNVAEKFEIFNERLGLQKFSGDLEKFCAVGDDQGLFIVINRDQKDWIPTGDKAFASQFEIQFWEEQNSYRFTFQNDRISVYES